MNVLTSVNNHYCIGLVCISTMTHYVHFVIKSLFVHTPDRVTVISNSSLIPENTSDCRALACSSRYNIDCHIMQELLNGSFI